VKGDSKKDYNVNNDENVKKPMPVGKELQKKILEGYVKKIEFEMSIYSS
jgi:hypothetical protein